MNIRFVISISILGLASNLYADQFHYRNFIIGDRAIGLGGAYTAISDDASGVYYNPAGTAFALSNDVSGSANALYSSKVTYKNAIANNDFTENSSGSIPSFFGGLQKLDNFAKGLVLSFGVFFDNNALQDQNDIFTNINLGTPAPCTTGGAARDPFILERYHRAANQRSSTMNISAGLAYRVLPRLALGVALNYINVDELVQDYQDALNSSNSCSGGIAVNTSTLSTQNVRQHLLGYAIQPVLALQAIITERLSLGLTLKAAHYVAQSFDLNSESRIIQTSPSNQTAINNAARTGSGAAVTGATIAEVNTSAKSENPLGTPPYQVSLGLAYFYSSRLLFALDSTYTSAVNNVDNIEGLGYAYQKNAVWNFAAGLEFYFLPSFPLRVGWFTNNDARPTLHANQSGQRDHVDYNGESLFLAWVQPNSQLGAGIVLQQGTGEAQKLAGTNVIQKVSASSYTFAFSATHSL